MGHWRPSILGACERVTKSSGSAFQGFTESLGVDTPEIVLTPVYEGDRNLVGELLDEARVAVDVDRSPVGTSLRGDLINDGQRDVAQMAILSHEEHDPGVL
jgi:hypothetical protein